MVDHDRESTKTALAIDMLLYFFLAPSKLSTFDSILRLKFRGPCYNRESNVPKPTPPLKQAPGGKWYHSSSPANRFPQRVETLEAVILFRSKLTRKETKKKENGSSRWEVRTDPWFRDPAPAQKKTEKIPMICRLPNAFFLGGPHWFVKIPPDFCWHVDSSEISFFGPGKTAVCGSIHSHQLGNPLRPAIQLPPGQAVPMQPHIAQAATGGTWEVKLVGIPPITVGDCKGGVPQNALI